MDENYQILKEMHDRLLKTNEHWHFIVGGAGVEPNCKAFMEKIKEYFTEDSAQLVSDTDPNVTEMVTFTQSIVSVPSTAFQTPSFPLLKCCESFCCPEPSDGKKFGFLTAQRTVTGGTRLIRKLPQLDRHKWKSLALRGCVEPNGNFFGQ
ncbi:hypothetical protein GPALN_002335 [Globodera pallida]|nr:hypothetical protein GPALN_002335 [Globodera pallida]